MRRRSDAGICFKQATPLLPVWVPNNTAHCAYAAAQSRRCLTTPADTASVRVRRKTAAAERRSSLPRLLATSDCSGGGAQDVQPATRKSTRD